MLKEPYKYISFILGHRQYSPAISLPSFSCFATRYLLVIARAVVDKSGMIENQMGLHDRSEMGCLVYLPHNDKGYF
jgi:hypothetical protein